MISFFSNSFRNRLVLVLSLAQVFFLGSLVLVGSHFIESRVEEQFNKRIDAFSAQFESAAKTAMLSMDLGTLESLSQEAVQLPDISEFAIYLGDKKVIDQTSPRIKPTLKSTQSHVVTVSGQNIGRIEYTISLDEVTTNKKNMLVSLISLCLIELILAIGVALIIGFYVGNKADYLIDGIQKYSDGHLEFKYEVVSKDEFGMIATAFNSMTQRIFENSQKIDALSLQNMQSAKMASLGEMAGGVAHEINNPLTIIQGKAAVLIRKLKANTIDPKVFLEDLEKIEATGKRIAKIISGLRTFSRNAEMDPKEPIELVKLIDDSLSLCSERFRHHKVDLKVNLKIDSNTQIFGRPTQISQVLLNLLGNAFDAVESRDEKWVEISAEVVASNLVMSVTDSGPGIAPELVQKLMQPFFTTKQVGKGTGLGLSISKGIIEEHKGRLFYDSSSAKTRFVFEIPLLASNQASA